jgi:hypothetical protein
MFSLFQQSHMPLVLELYNKKPLEEVNHSRGKKRGT